jgi:hypothetical protein
MSSTTDDSADISEQATPAKALSAIKTPASGSVVTTPSKWQEASSFVNSLTPEAKAAAKYHSDLLKKVSRYSEIKKVILKARFYCFFIFSNACTMNCRRSIPIF